MVHEERSQLLLGLGGTHLTRGTSPLADDPDRLRGSESFTLRVDPTHPDYRLSVSVGIAEFRSGESIEDVIQRADRALYRAKSSGRDLVVVG